jgi:Family of unknown function (DUF6499)
MVADADICDYDFDFVDFAQEFLRRNADYQAQFVRLSNGALPNLESPDFRNMARSWGLEFRISTST